MSFRALEAIFFVTLVVACGAPSSESAEPSYDGGGEDTATSQGGDARRVDGNASQMVQADAEEHETSIDWDAAIESADDSMSTADTVDTADTSVVTDARDASTPEAQVDPGSALCGTPQRMCGPGNVCVITSSVDASCAPALDGGACPTDYRFVRGCCRFASSSYACMPIPAACSGHLDCDCAGTLCGSSFIPCDSVTSEGQLQCVVGRADQ
jgi:hypothetical protein